MAETLHELLQENGIRMRSVDAGRQEHCRCPKCDGGSKREDSLSVSIDDDAMGFTGVCHRGSCGAKFGGRVQRSSRPSPFRKPRQPPAAHVARPVTVRLLQWFAARGIPRETVQAFGVYEAEHFFGDQVGREPAMVFPYTWRGELVNRKYRRFAEKHPQAQERDPLPTLFNADRLLSDPAPETLVWVEGEPDVLACHAADVQHPVVTLKDGAGEGGMDKRLAALETHAAELAKVKRIILAGDNDAPGIALREELARRLGRHRCFIVAWPDGCKDANDVLLRCGPSEVCRRVDDAEPYPIDGLQRVAPGSLAKLRSFPPPVTVSTGTRATDAILRVPTEGRLCIVTGFPSHGKTNWLRFLMVHTAQHHGRRWAVFSPEMQPWEHYIAECAEVFIGKSFWSPEEFGGMSTSELEQAEEFLRSCVTMLASDAEDASPTVDWILEMARAAVLRDGCTDLAIDPWNEVEHTHGRDVTETEYIGRSLQRFKAFGLRHGCNIWIVVHPAKPAPIQPNQKRVAPGPYDCAGSAHWANKSDLGITVHSPHDSVAEVHLWKARFKRFGKRGDVATLNFDRSVGRYSDPPTAVYPPAEVV